MEKLWTPFLGKLQEINPLPPSPPPPPVYKGPHYCYAFAIYSRKQKDITSVKKKTKKKQTEKREKLLYDFVCHLQGINKGIADHLLLALNTESILHI